MRVLFLTDNYPPEVNAPAVRTYEHVQVWRSLGVEVTVLTCAPNFPQGRVYDGYRNRLYARGIEDGVDVIRVWTYIAANEGFAKRILDYVSYGAAATVAGLFVRADVIVATSPQFFTAVAGRVLAGVRGLPWVMEVRDLWPESIRAVGAATRVDRLLDYLERLELHLYRHADRVVVVTNAFLANLRARGVDPAKISVVTNGVHASDYAARPPDDDAPPPTALRERLGLAGKTVVGYVGTHGMAHGLGFVLDCVGDAPEHVHFLFIGGGARKEYLADRVAREGLTNVTMLPPVTKSAIRDYLAVVDVALVPLRRSDTFKTVIPSKIFESAAMGIPILLGVEGESREIVERYGAGLAFRPEDRADFVAQLTRLTTDDAVYARCRDNCAALAAAYDRRALAERMYDVLASLVPGSAQASGVPFRGA